MAFTAMLILCASVLLVATRVSCYDDHEKVEKKDQSERQSLLDTWLYPRNVPKAPESSPLLLNQPIATLPRSPSPITCAQAKPPASHQSQSLLSMWLYSGIPEAPSPVICAQATPPTTSSTPIVNTHRDCMPLCAARCKVEPHRKICRRLCMKCCSRCKCVPPGEYGTNMDKCGKCYTDMEYHGHKCP
ncbi:gibberellin-regulated protein 14-like [Rosa rugosa]|uniref:gibberellin-regulated protein 14-like n=1 Tax=Rosa rugosa TaxID=74645 RepID=UPI002B400841|nr:gibberellin-regulated protein 14-like [Rosa rugosa]